MQADWLSKLLILQDRDIRCDNFRRQLEAVPDIIAREQKSIEEEKAALEIAREEILKLEIQRKEFEGEIEDIEAATVRYKTQQLEVKKNDAYAALQHEIDDAGDKIGRLEDQVLDMMEKLDVGNEQLRNQQKVTSESIEILQSHITKLENSIESYRKDLETAEADRTESYHAIEAELSRQYDFVKKQVKRGPYIVELREGKCSGCHLKVSGDVDSSARKGHAIVRCNNCGRIVYPAAD